LAWLSHASFAVGTHAVDHDSKISVEDNEGAEAPPQQTKKKMQQVVRLLHSADHSWIMDMGRVWRRQVDALTESKAVTVSLATTFEKRP
jgi:hypothetical protein